MLKESPSSTKRLSRAACYLVYRWRSELSLASERRRINLRPRGIPVLGLGDGSDIDPVESNAETQKRRFLGPPHPVLLICCACVQRVCVSQLGHCHVDLPWKLL